MSEVEQPQVKRGPGRPPKVQSANDMAEVQSPGIAKAEAEIEAYRQAQLPPVDLPPVEPPIVATFAGGWILEGGVVVTDPVPVRPKRESLVIVRGESVTDEQWGKLKGQLAQMGVTFRVDAK